MLWPLLFEASIFICWTDVGEGEGPDCELERAPPPIPQAPSENKLILNCVSAFEVPMRRARMLSSWEAVTELGRDAAPAPLPPPPLASVEYLEDGDEAVAE